MKSPAPSCLLTAPVAGWALPLVDVPDPVFAGGMLGDGVAIDPTGNELCAPCDGELLSIAPTRHAVTLRADNGAELLLHVGIDTVTLKGEGFEAHAAAGNRVRTGDLLVRFDLDTVARRAPSLVTPLIVTNGERFEIVRRQLGQAIAAGDFLMELRPVADARSDDRAPPKNTVSRRLRVTLPHGLHARPAALVAQRVRDFDAEVLVQAHGRSASAKSAVSLMSLGLRCDDAVVLEAAGVDARAALNALEPLLGHTDSAASMATTPGTGAPPPAGAKLPGVVAARGFALGVAATIVRRERQVSESGAGVAQENAELARALAAVRAALAARNEGVTGPRQEILAAHREFLDDPVLAAAAAASIGRGCSAGYAWRSAIRSSTDALRDLEDPRLAERVDDLLDLESQVLAALAGDSPDAALTLPDRAIVLADQLLPSQLIALEATKLAGIGTARGGATSHVAILAAAMGKPMLVSLGTELLGIEPGTPLLLDAESGVLQIDPPPVDLASAERALGRRREREVAEHEAARNECATADGGRIEVFANLGSAAEATDAIARGAEGCGLLRTEFLFLGRRTAPDAAFQAAEYQRVVDAFAGRPVVIRSLDVGDDKSIPYLAMPREHNPALGLRGVRTSFRQPELLRAQLEAVLSVRPLTHVRLMLPMVNEPAEILCVRALIDELAARLGITARPALGAMIETPSAAVIADRICEVADFVSIGTNDLTQYTLAMDRRHPDLATQLDGLHPAVLRLIAATVAAAIAQSRPVGVCGGLAADPIAVPVLLGLGVQELSVPPGAIPETKALIRKYTLGECRKLAERALGFSSAAEVRALVRAHRPDT
jgi:phosphocarrier protein FPr/phosphocarrier protein